MEPVFAIQVILKANTGIVFTQTAAQTVLNATTFGYKQANPNIFYDIFSQLPFFSAVAVYIIILNKTLK